LLRRTIFIATDNAPGDKGLDLRLGIRPILLSSIRPSLLLS